MAKRINRKPSKLKEEIKLTTTISAINSAKTELSRIKMLTVEEAKNFKGNINITLKAKKDREKALSKLAEVDRRIEMRFEQDNELAIEIDKKEDNLKIKREIKTKIDNDIIKLSANRDSFLKSFEAEKSKKIEELDSIKLNKLQDYKEEIEKIKETKTNLELQNSALKEENKGAYNKNSELVAEGNELRTDITTLNNSLQNVLDVRTKAIKKAISEVRNELVEKEDRSRIASVNLEKILETISLAQKKELEILSNVSKFEEELNMAQASLSNTREEGKIEIQKIKDKIKIETGELNKISSQRFGIVKANKDLTRLYAYIKKLYEKANVPMPKIDLNI